MADEQLIKGFLKHAGLEDDKNIYGKTQEMIRKLKLKVSLGTLKKAEGCRYIIAIELACNLLDLPIDKEKFVFPKSISRKVYQEGLIICKNILGLKNEIDCISKLAVQYGSESVPQARVILEKYKSNQLDTLDENRRSATDDNGAVCQAAAYYIASSIHNKKLKLKKPDVASIAEVDVMNFTKVLESMQQVVDQLKNPLLKDKSLNRTSSSSNSSSSSSSSSSIDNNTDNMVNINGKEYPNPNSINIRESINKTIVNPLKNHRDVLKQSLLDKEKQEHIDKMKTLEGVEEKRLRIRAKYERFLEHYVDNKRNKKNEKNYDQIISDSM